MGNLNPDWFRRVTPGGLPLPPSQPTSVCTNQQDREETFTLAARSRPIIATSNSRAPTLQLHSPAMGGVLFPRSSPVWRKDPARGCGVAQPSLPGPRPLRAEAPPPSAAGPAPSRAPYGPVKKSRPGRCTPARASVRRPRLA